jgi:hypothetical protein
MLVDEKVEKDSDQRIDCNIGWIGREMTLCSTISSDSKTQSREKKVSFPLVRIVAYQKRAQSNNVG